MMRTVAPNDLGGRLFLNCALTTPELPENLSDVVLGHAFLPIRTVWPGDLAPHHSDLCAANLL